MDSRPRSVQVQLKLHGGATKHELDKIKQQSRKVNEESVTKTREMLRIVHESQDAGVHTLKMLNDQGDQLKNMDNALDDVSVNLTKAEIRLKNIQRADEAPCCCLPCVSCFQRNPDKQRSCVNRKNPTPVVPLHSPIAVEEAESDVTTIRQNGKSNTSDRWLLSPGKQKIRTGDEVEDNLSEVSDHVKTLKGIALDMNAEVTDQNKLIDNMITKADTNLNKTENITQTTTNLVKKKRSSIFKCCCY